MSNPATKPFHMGVLDRILKEAIYPYHLLTARQITRLLHPTAKLGNLTTVQTRLKALTDAKYLTAAHLPTADGVRPFVYCLGTSGRKILRDEGYDIDIYFERTELQTRSYGWFMHLLELNDFLITSKTADQAVPQLHLEDWLHDFTIAKNPPLAVKKDGKIAQVNPDGFLHFILSGSGKTRHYRFLVELDRGTEGESKFRKKIRDYLICNDQEALQARFCPPGSRLHGFLFPTTAGERRVSHMRSLARAELEAFDKTIGATSYRNQLFKFAAIPPLMQQPLNPQTIFCQPFWYIPKDGDTNRKTTLIDLSQ